MFDHEDDEERVAEPGEEGGVRRDRWWAIPLALTFAALGALVAPESWPAGDGELVVVSETSRFELPVIVGSTEPLAGAGDGLAVELPDGVPVDAPVRVRVSSTDGRDLDLGDAEIEIVLPDGESELVPVLQSDDGVLDARRQPPNDAWIVLSLLGAVLVLWVSEVVPLHVTSLAIPVVLAAFGVGTAEEVLAPFFNPIIVLFFAGFLMAEAMRRVGLDRWAAVMIVARAGGGPIRLFLAMIGVSAFMSMWMSNTAAVAVLLPVALAVTAPIAHEGYRKAVVLGLAYAATIGGVGSAIGTPANMLAITFVEDLTDRTISFAEWFAIGLPMTVLFLPAMAAYLWWRTGVSIDPREFVAARREAIAQRSSARPFRRPQWEVLGVFGAVVLLWLTQSWHEANIGIIALGGAVVLMVLGRILPSDLGRISWTTLLTFAGGLTLGIYLVLSGTSDWIVTSLGFLADWPPFLGITAVAVVTLMLTTVASNTASAATLIPLAVPLAGLLGVDPVLLVAIVAIASSIDFALVVGTPPTMLAYSTRLFSAGEILRIGVPLDLIGIMLLVTAVPLIWQLLGVI